MVFLITVIACIVMANRQLGELSAKTREILLDIPLATLIPIFAALMVLRRLFPPIWYTVPTGIVMTISLSDKLGILGGVLVFQAIKVVDIFSFVAIRYLFMRWIHAFFDRGAQSCLLPKVAPSCATSPPLVCLSTTLTLLVLAMCASACACIWTHIALLLAL